MLGAPSARHALQLKFLGFEILVKSTEQLLFDQPISWVFVNEHIAIEACIGDLIRSQHVEKLIGAAHQSSHQFEVHIGHNFLAKQKTNGEEIFVKVVHTLAIVLYVSNYFPKNGQLSHVLALTAPCCPLSI
jgi:hypothetical protein